MGQVTRNSVVAAIVHVLDQQNLFRQETSPPSSAAGGECITASRTGSFRVKFPKR
jgi:hypothetical protein